jgi:CBS domain-containing protein
LSCPALFIRVIIDGPQGVRRLPVVDGHELVGIVTQADVARNLPDDKIGDLVEAISKAPSNS